MAELEKILQGPSRRPEVGRLVAPRGGRDVGESGQGGERRLQLERLEPGLVEASQGGLVFEPGQAQVFVPGGFAQDAVLVVLELPEVRVDRRLDRPLAEKPGAEGADRSDEDPLEAVQGGVEAGPDRAVLRGQPGPLQLDLEPPPE